MDVLVTCKYEEDPIKNEGARVVTTLNSNFSDAQGQITLVLVSVSGRNLNSSKLSCMSWLPARMKKGNKQCLFDTPRTVMVNKEIMSEYLDIRLRTSVYALS